MKSDHEKLLLNNRFIVTIGALYVSCSRVTNISESYAVDQVSEGGRHRAICLPSQKTGPETLVIERAVKADALDRTIDVALSPGMPVVGIIVMVLDASGVPMKVYSADQGVVTRVDTSELNGKSGDILLKTITITHSGLSLR